MRHRPDGSFKWIGHYMDLGKISCAIPLVRKSEAEVAVALSNQVFAVLGIPPKIFLIMDGSL